jgi:hypothetical protein
MSRASRSSVVTFALMSLMPTIALASSTAQCPVSASAWRFTYDADRRSCMVSRGDMRPLMVEELVEFAY